MQLRGEFVGILLVGLAGNQLVLAAREELHEIVEELAGLGKTAVAVELQAGKIAAQENPVVDFVEHAALRVGVFQQRLAERVEGLEGDVLAAFADAAHHASFHFTSRFIGER